MKTLDQLTDELYAQGPDAQAHALALIRCLDYPDLILGLDGEAYRAAVRTILVALAAATRRRVDELADALAAAQAAMDAAADAEQADSPPAHLPGYPQERAR